MKHLQLKWVEQAAKVASTHQTNNSYQPNIETKLATN